MNMNDLSLICIAQTICVTCDPAGDTEVWEREHEKVRKVEEEDTAK